MKLFLILFLMMMLIFGCGKQAIYTEETKFPIGKKLYISKCGGCHRLYSKYEYKPEQWDIIMISKRSKAKLSTDQESEIINYLKER